MAIADLVFCLFAAALIFSGAMVISARNPVHAVLFLILAFFSGAGLCLLLGAEFIAMMLVVVYVGAVAVLFLFVVMMLDINFSELRSSISEHLPVGALVGALLIVELLAVFYTWTATSGAAANAAVPIPDAAEVSNTKAIGFVLYTHYVYLFQVAGLILLVAMIGAIVLTLRTRGGVHRQAVSRQVARTRSETIEIVKVTPKTGV